MGERLRACAVGRHHEPKETRASGRSSSFSTLPPGPTSTAPRPTRRRQGPSMCPAPSGSLSCTLPSSTSRPITSSTAQAGGVRRVRPARSARCTGERNSTASGRSARAGSSGRRGCSAGRVTTSSARCSSSAGNETRCVVDDQRGCPTYVGHLAEATLNSSSCRWPLPRGRWRRLHLGGFRGGDLRGGEPLVSRRRISTRSSAARRRDPPTPCCVARTARRRRCRTGARVCGPVWRDLGRNGRSPLSAVKRAGGPRFR